MQNPFIRVWQFIMYGNKAKILSLFALIILGAGVTVGLIASSQTQDTRQHASEISPTPPVCQEFATDTVLLIDTSGSMNEVATSVSTAEESNVLAATIAPTKKPTSAPVPISQQKITKAKTAANTYIDKIYQKNQTLPGDKHKLGLTTFSTNSVLNSALSNITTIDERNALETKINGLTPHGNTCMECGILTANKELLGTNGRANIKKVVILLSDGKPTYVLNASGTPVKASSTLVAEDAAKKAVTAGNAKGIIYFVIGLGTNSRIDQPFLQNLAQLSGGKYYYAPTGDELNQIYLDIAAIVGRGSINGTIFKDANNNKLFDKDEEILSGWTIEATNQDTNSPAGTSPSSTDGTYSLINLCDGNYRVKETVKTGWSQTSPISPSYYSVKITKGNVAIDKNFGNIEVPAPEVTLSANPLTVVKGNPTTLTWSSTNATSCTAANGWIGTKTTSGSEPSSNLSQATTFVITCKGDGGSTTKTVTVNVIDPSPTPTRIPNSTTLSFTLDFHGIGKSGDTANPFPASCQRGASLSAVNCLSNQSPKNTTRPLTITLLDQSNNPATKSGTVAYDNTSGNFKGMIDVGIIPSGKYTLIVSSPIYLRKKVIANKQIIAETDNATPETELIVGDVNGDNKLTVLDYTLLLGCYTDLQPAVACDPDKFSLTDLNNDGFVNQFDYNLFLRDLPVSQGD